MIKDKEFNCLRQGCTFAASASLAQNGHLTDHHGQVDKVQVYPIVWLHATKFFL